jgi:hypothetical protein
VRAYPVLSNQGITFALITILKRESKLKFGSNLQTKVFILLSDAKVIILVNGINNTLLSLN